MEGTPICRICIESERPEEMISPCHCRGTQRYVHRDCLDQWREQHINRSYYRCSVCHYEYKISRVWWGKLIAHKATSIILSMVGLTTGAMVLGYGSSASYNKIFYWFHHMRYMSPHRLQILFHCVAWIGIPGLCMGAKRLLSNGLLGEGEGEREAPIEFPQAIGRGLLNAWVAQPREVHHYHHRQEQKRDENVPDSPENSDDEKEERKVKKTKIAPYEPKSTAVWVPLVAGSVYSFYFTYEWAFTKCSNICNAVQGRVENIN